jgi:hypothetical protein
LFERLGNISYVLWKPSFYNSLTNMKLVDVSGQNLETRDTFTRVSVNWRRSGSVIT